MQFSYSRAETFEQCPFKYAMRYINKFDVLPSDDPSNALKLGTAMHTGIEKDVIAATKEYYMSYPIITDEHINETIKLEYTIPLVKNLIPDNAIFEYELSDDDFIGYIDCLVRVAPNLYDLYDFKYSNNVKNYIESKQLHIYKYYFEKLNPGNCIRYMYYVMIPKVSIKQKKTETLEGFRRRINQELVKEEPYLFNIKYDANKVIDYLLTIKHCHENDDRLISYPSYLCNWCDYQNYCEKGETYMLLPKNERRNIEKVEKRTIWLYGAPFSGKTTFANKFPDVLMLNTDGNITFVDAPYISIKNEVKVEGRQTKITTAWEIFKSAVGELEKKENDFKTLVVDLLEDLYEHCRIYMYDEMGITHESDDSFRAWDKVRTEYLSTMKRFMNLDYENIIIISHEDTSKDLTRKNGDKITSIKPNLQDKVANKIAGMVHIVARVIADDDERTLSFKQNEVVFGGGRLTVDKNKIPLDYDEFIKLFDEASKNASEQTKPKEATKITKALKESLEETQNKHCPDPIPEPPVEATESMKPVEPDKDTPIEKIPQEIAETPKKRTRKSRNE